MRSKKFLSVMLAAAMFIGNMTFPGIADDTETETGIPNPGPEIETESETTVPETFTTEKISAESETFPPEETEPGTVKTAKETKEAKVNLEESETDESESEESEKMQELSEREILTETESELYLESLYAITVDEENSYEIAFLNEKEEYAEGETVTATVTPDTNYEISAVTAEFEGNVATVHEQEKTDLIGKEAEDIHLTLKDAPEKLEKTESGDSETFQAESKLGEAKVISFRMPAAPVTLRASAHPIKDIPGVYGFRLLAPYSDNIQVGAVRKISYLSDGKVRTFDMTFDTAWVTIGGKSGMTTKKAVAFTDQSGKVLYRMLAYCLQPSAAAPQDGKIETDKIVPIHSEKLMSKAMFYLLCGPAWGKTITGSDGKKINLKEKLKNKGINTFDENYSFTHFLLSYLYDKDGVDSSFHPMIEDVINDLNDLPKPETSFSQSVAKSKESGDGKIVESDSVTFQSISGDQATLNLPAGVSMKVNGRTYGPGQAASVFAGESFKLYRSDLFSGEQTYHFSTHYATSYKPYRINIPSQQNVSFSYTANSGLNLKVVWQPPMSTASVKKVSAHQATVKDLDTYSLNGAVFTLTNKNDNSINYTFICDEDGNTGLQNVLPGEYTLHESAAPKGYKQADDKSVTIAAGVKGQTIQVEDDPIMGNISMLVQKVVAIGYATNRSLEHACFTVSYFDNEDGTGTPVQTWGLQTLNENGPDGSVICCARLDNAHLVFGNLAYGENTVPLGCLKIQETKAPEGYELNNKIIKVRISQSGNSVVYCSDTGQPMKIFQTVTCEEFPSFGDMKIRKLSEEQENVPDGDAVFEGAVFEIISDNDYQVVTRNAPGSAINKGETVTEIRSDKDGIAITTGGMLQTGNYYIREKTAPKGYKLSDAEIHFQIEAHMLSDLSDDKPFRDKPVRAGFRFRKKDQELAEGRCAASESEKAVFAASHKSSDGNLMQGDASLKDAVFCLINQSASKVVVNGQTYLPGQKISEIHTDENGDYESPRNYLPYGTYQLKEVKSSEGYNLRGKNIDQIFRIQKDDDGQIKDLGEDSPEDDVIRFDLEIIKFAGLLDADDQTDDMKPLKGAVFDIYLESSESGKPYLSITTDEDGLATTKNADYPHGRLPYGKYRVTESFTPDGYIPVKDFTVDGTKDGGVYDGRTYRGIYKNDRPQAEWLQLRKADISTGKTVLKEGTVFQILDKNRKPVEMKNSSPKHEKVSSFVTDQNGVVSLPQRLKAGTYYLHEVKAPEGYLLNTKDVIFNVDQRNEWEDTITISMEDTPSMGQLVLTKHDRYSGKKLSGAVFDVYADEDIRTGDGTLHAGKGDKVDTFTTGEDGTGVSKELYLGKYHVLEKRAPKGYRRNNTAIPFELTYKDQVTPVVTEALDAFDEKRKGGGNETESEAKDHIASLVQPSVKTGDRTPIGLVSGALVFASLLVMATLAILRKRKHW